MTLHFTSTLIVFLQSNIHLFLFSLLLQLLFLLLWLRMFSNFPFFLATSNANLKPGGSLKWKKRLVQYIRLSVPLIKVLKIVRLISLLPDMPRLSSPRQLDLFSFLNLCILSSVLWVALLPHLPPLLTFSIVSLLGVSIGFCLILEIPLFSLPAKSLALQSQRLPVRAPPSHVP